MPASRRIAIQFCAIIATLIVWQLAVSSGFINADLLPTPTIVGDRIIALLKEPRMLYNIALTSAEVLIAFAIATPLGVAIGMFLGENAYFGTAFKPFFYFFASVPKSVFLPVFILSLGIGVTQKVTFGIFQMIFVLVISAIAAVDGVPRSLVTIARAYGASRSQLYLQIYLPSMLPVIVEGVRLAMIFNMTGILFAEMYVSHAGLGHMIQIWGMRFDLPDLLAGIALATILSVAVNETLRWYERRVGQWRV